MAMRYRQRLASRWSDLVQVRRTLGPGQGDRGVRPRPRARLHGLRRADDPRRAAPALPRPGLEPAPAARRSRSARWRSTTRSRGWATSSGARRRVREIAEYLEIDRGGSARGAPGRRGAARRLARRCRAAVRTRTSAPTIGDDRHRRGRLSTAVESQLAAEDADLDERELTRAAAAIRPQHEPGARSASELGRLADADLADHAPRPLRKLLDAIGDRRTASERQRVQR